MNKTLSQHKAILGRPTKKTPSTIEILLKAAEIGAPIKSCCAVAGISTDTLSEWTKQDPDLKTLIEEARERGRVTALSNLQRAGKRDWRASAEWLRFSFRSEYSAKAEVVTEQPVDAIRVLIGGIRSMQDQPINPP